MIVTFDCGNSSGSCCKGKHIPETAQIYGADEYYTGALRFVKLCKDQVDNALAYGWNKLTPYAMVSAVCEHCKRSFPELQTSNNNQFITCLNCKVV